MYTITRQQLSDLLVDFLTFTNSNNHLTDIEMAEEFVEEVADQLTEAEEDDEYEID